MKNAGDISTAAALIQKGELAKAEEIALRFLKAEPQNLDGLNILAYISSRLGKHLEAYQYAQKAVDLAPTSPMLRTNLCLILLTLKMFDRAEKEARTSLGLDPQQTVLYDFLGQALIGLNKPAEALQWLLKAESVFPEDARIKYRTGTALAMKGDYVEAESVFRKVLALNPHDADSYTNLGVVLRYQGRYKEALVSFQKALHVDPNHVTAHLNRGATWLLFGNYVQGWPEFTYRFLTHDVIRSKLNQPFWDGSSFVGKKVFLYAEQGYGDTIQFARYIPLVKRLGGEVYVETQAPLKRWLSQYKEIDQLIVEGESRPEFHFQAPFMSLPHILKTTLDTIPPVVCPVKSSLPERERTASDALKVGIVWSGNPTHADDARRSSRMEDFLAFSSVEGVELVSLQKGAEPNLLAKHAIADGVSQCADFMDTARAIAGLDVVITVDTSVAHLAATLGKPTWILIAIPNDWRWLLEREDSPWYPSVRLFRQKELGKWEPVLDQIRRELVKFKSAL